MVQQQRDVVDDGDETVIDDDGHLDGVAQVTTEDGGVLR